MSTAKKATAEVEPTHTTATENAPETGAIETGAIEATAETPDTMDTRTRIRSFLQHLFSTLGDPLDECWPDVSPLVFQGHMSRLREQITRLYEYIDRMDELNRGQKLLARFLPESAMQLLRLDWEAPPGRFDVAPIDAARLAGRPPAIVANDQLYCTVDSTARRAEQIVSSFDAAKGRVLLVGDDDLTSALLAPQFSGELHMLDLDERLLSFVQENVAGITTHRHDLILKGVPKDWFESFDAVALDPPWDYHGVWAFLTKAIYCLKRHRDARIFLSLRPLQLELQGNHMARFWKRLTRMGLACETILPCYNLYDLKTINTPENAALFAYHLPQIKSPLMDLLRQVPFTYAHLFELRRLEGFVPNKLAHAWFRWWHAA